MSTPEHRRLTLWLGAVLAAAFMSGACDDDDDTGPDTGSIEVTTTTTGTDLDADGFTVSIDGGAAQAIGANATATYSSVATGTRTVTLAGVATNCGVTDDNPVTVTVNAGEAAEVAFPVLCETVIAGLTGTIAFETDRTGDFEVFKMAADGSNPVNLSNNDADDFHPDWIPDGTKLAFTSDRDGNSEIYSMNADGSSQTRLTDNAADDTAPEWSPDGTQILFQTDRDGD
ncbi:MAG: TolB family protein, partial [Gemmatimonadales bacterium]